MAQITADWPKADWQGALTRAEAGSPFLSRAMGRLPELVALLAAGDGEGAIGWSRRAGAGAPDIGAALRRERLALALALGIGDLAGAFPLARVVEELSDLADRALDAAMAHAITSRVPDAVPAGFFALGLGKHGARELNYSSDIDPILLFDPDTMPRRPRDDPGEAAAQYARTVVRTLSTPDAEGYVFRVDLRLRPASEVSPLAIPVEAALTHYESSALAWERAAFIRARACAGDVPMGEAFLTQIRPFVWRKSLDFGAIAEIGRLTRRIRAAHGKVEVIGPGFDIKRARGGIREIEFFAQVHQLIHGGRNPALRLRGTRASLDALADTGIITTQEAADLGAAYDRLRTIEHRLQMVSDLQTHSLPKDMAAIDAVARLDGLPGAEALLAQLRDITAMVGDRYDRLVAACAVPDSVGGGGPSSFSLEEELERLGFADPPGLAARIDGWRGGTVRALRSETALMALEAVQPALLRQLAAAPDPDRAIIRWEQLITALPSVVNLFRLLEARPALLEVLVRVLSLAPPLADALARRADLLDALIDASAFDLPPAVPVLARDLSATEVGDDYQRLLDGVRRKVGEKRFAMGVQLIEAAKDPLAVGAGLCRVAEAAIDALANATIAEFEATHGRIPGGELVIVGLGRLGGGMLTHASDLDIVYLFTGDFNAESDGRRPLGATMYFNRLAQRVSAALSVPTAEGALYEVDTRLRPQGTQGPLAVGYDSFALYQREQAWTWEHMALIRARVLFGSDAARADFAAITTQILGAPRDRAAITADILDMRNKMAAHKPPKGAIDVKLLRGGLVDIEFLTHCLQLREGVGQVPGMAEALADLAEAGHVPWALTGAHDVLSRVLVAGRLLAPDAEAPGPAPRDVLAKACGSGDWDDLMARVHDARRVVAQAWAGVFGQALEVE
ncbi:bifunctional [glutamine synthetase] adenylyltransferase/[glutamine synthetase]-adenylyl-L-tyrosine phosphorylase [Novosphingobium sp. FSY-8]|uniref:Bifunctional [glutamine synthetase] adenylyltransferase/[glutamine synthetase]-adenylyl-L-tyrosine phosphorylase n=1 Tax=Novosphingobium ovatum TaxID=1908523 RepID=A0ABW9XEV1_9SPHN|nr:bifunctional [glutamine synthetase] adenylyltransferase/[glutamine synthetase]-adenylyl-L-tyrosine phosphorylase [Novosphingobium ovatum]NBC37039.1 bifunctional [glutamine synthetase] adenylyltransferase/[glutamine synthetase]-adenylyl-L-tyrosine phosphorylase [Novosphingobium ovatum]